jgi:hypothetical protein
MPRSRTTAAVLAASLTVLPAACGTAQRPTQVQASGSAAGTASLLTLVSRVPGQLEESEPGPMGTLIGGATAADRFWVQAVDPALISTFQSAEGAVATPGGTLVRAFPGASQLLASSSGRTMLISAQEGGDPARVARMAFELPAVPTGWRFVPATPAARTALDAPDAEVPPALGVTRLTIRSVMGLVTAEVVPVAADSLLGLVVAPRSLGAGAHLGQVDVDRAGKGRSVLLVDLPEQGAAVVVHGTGDLASLAGALDELRILAGREVAR